MRVKYEVYRDGDWLVAAAIVKFNKREEKRLAELIEAEGEITLCFLTTLTEVENPLIIRQEQEFPLEAPDYDPDEEHFTLSGLLAMVEEEVADLRELLFASSDDDAERRDNVWIGGERAMFERRYYHAEVITVNGKLVCAACGAEVDRFLRSPQRCHYPTAAVTIINQLPLLISVSDMTAMLVAEIPISASTTRIIRLVADDDIADELKEMLVSDVVEQGGALNLSGFYTISDQTAQKITAWLRANKLRLT